MPLSLIRKIASNLYGPNFFRNFWLYYAQFSTPHWSIALSALILTTIFFLFIVLLLCLSLQWNIIITSIQNQRSKWTSITFEFRKLKWFVSGNASFKNYVHSNMKVFWHENIYKTGILIKTFCYSCKAYPRLYIYILTLFNKA